MYLNQFNNITTTKFFGNNYSSAESMQKYTVYACVPKSSGSVAIAVSVFSLPFHVLLVKLLVTDVGLSLPHHQIMLILIMSDALQIFAASFVSSTGMILQLTTESSTCVILRDILVFTSSLTVIVSSLAVVTFAIERMTICMHFLRYRRIFITKRIRKLLYGYWVIGTVIAIIAALTNNARKTETSVIETTSFQILCALFILPSSSIITSIYSRILLFSRERIIQVAPSLDVNKLRDVATFRKRQIRIALVAAVVCIAYVVCMVPASTAFFLELTGLIENHPDVKKVLISLMMLNTLADPFIYGFGITQTRQILINIMKSVLPARATRLV